MLGQSGYIRCSEHCFGLVAVVDVFSRCHFGTPPSYYSYSLLLSLHPFAQELLFVHTNLRVSNMPASTTQYEDGEKRSNERQRLR